MDEENVALLEEWTERTDRIEKVASHVYKHWVKHDKKELVDFKYYCRNEWMAQLMFHAIVTRYSKLPEIYHRTIDIGHIQKVSSGARSSAMVVSVNRVPAIVQTFDTTFPKLKYKGFKFEDVDHREKDPGWETIPSWLCMLLCQRRVTCGTSHNFFPWFPITFAIGADPRHHPPTKGLVIQERVGEITLQMALANRTNIPDFTPDALDSIILQIAMALRVLVGKYKIVHNDLHTGNILISRTKAKYVLIGEREYRTYGWMPYIIDFDWASVEVNDKLYVSDVMFTRKKRIIPPHRLVSARRDLALCLLQIVAGLSSSYRSYSELEQDPHYNVVRCRWLKRIRVSGVPLLNSSRTVRRGDLIQRSEPLNIDEDTMHFLRERGMSVSDIKQSVAVIIENGTLLDVFLLTKAKSIGPIWTRRHENHLNFVSKRLRVHTSISELLGMREAEGEPDVLMRISDTLEDRIHRGEIRDKIPHRIVPKTYFALTLPSVHYYFWRETL